MPEQTARLSRHISELREAVRIHTHQIEDACIDKDCIEDLRVWLTTGSQNILNGAAAARARSAELLHVYIDVAPIAYNPGHFTADLSFFYRIASEAVNGSVRPAALDGLAIFHKRVVLYGGRGAAKVFSSENNELQPELLYREALPACVVEVVDPMVLSSRIVEGAACQTDGLGPEVPQAVAALFEEPLVHAKEGRQLLVCLGQFSTVRMERSAQLLMPVFEYTVPDRSCTDDPGAPDEPCDLFSRVDFPTQAFYPRLENTQQVVAEPQPRGSRQERQPG